MSMCPMPHYTAVVPSPPQVDVYIYEPKGISRVEAPNSLGHQFEDLIKITSTKDKVRPTTKEFESYAALFAWKFFFTKISQLLF